jgi:hypothetical protein
MKEYELTLIAVSIRESLMEYFKGTSIRRMTTSDCIYFKSADEDNGSHFYERRERELRNPRVMLYDGIRFALLRSNPGEIVFFDDIHISNELTEVEREVRSFIYDYLPGIKIGDEYAT